MILPATMRALVLRGRGFDNCVIETVAVPSPGPGQALVRVDAAGICASLIKLIEQGSDHSYLYGWDLAQYPTILGDEGSVTVVAKGEGLGDSVTLGGRYVVQPAVDSAPINHRERYRNNAANITKIACGHTLPGHLAQYMLLPEEVFAARCLVPIPDNTLPFAHAAISEPLSCCVSGQFHHIHLHQDGLTQPRFATNGLQPGGVCVIVGLGAMGRMHVDAALAAKPAVIIGSDPLASRRDRTYLLFAARAKSLGIELHLAGPDSIGAVTQAASKGRGADDLIIAVGSQQVIENSLGLLAKGGCANLFGGLRKGQEHVGIDANQVHYGEINITGSSGGTAWDIAQTLDWMCAGKLDAANHIAAIGGMDHALDFIAAVKAQSLDGKAVIYPHLAIGAPIEVQAWTADDEQQLLALCAAETRQDV